MKSSTKENWREVYADLSRYQNLYLYQQQLVEIIGQQFADLRGKHILEVGCGKGNEIVQLAKRGAACVGLDFSESAMELMQQRLAKESLTMPLARGDARRLPFQAGTFDLVYSQGVLEHFTQPGEVLQEQCRVLREGAIIVVELPNKWTLYTIYKKILMAANKWLPGWETQYSPRELKSLLEQNGFRILDCVGWDFLVLKILRKLRKKLGWRDKAESAFVRTVREKLQRNPILLNFFVSITVVGKKI
ncbi:class I SAM-dependent methyltransferase [candidate division KSB1 bacterium]|nr:class I SAM-dependent methyltransferase [candidate division KSB1 bacterium]